MDSNPILEQLVGAWSGKCETWFEPDVLADSSTIDGQFEQAIAPAFVRHQYRGSIQGKPRQGEATLVFNSVTKQFQESWMDSFHMNYAVMVSVGEAIANGLEVTGSYDVAKGEPPWGWKTVYQLIDADRLSITAYNISPQQEEAKAIHIDYHRQ